MDDKLKPYGYITTVGYFGVTGFMDYHGEKHRTWGIFPTEEEYLEHVREYNEERGA